MDFGVYKSVKALCRRDTIYRYGMLLESPVIEPSKSIKHVPLPEGHLYLVRGDSKKRALKIVKLRSLPEHHHLIERSLKHLSQSVRLQYYILRYDEGVKTLSLQLNKKYIDEMLREIYEITHSKYLWGSLRMDLRQRFKSVNNLVRSINSLAEIAFVYPEQLRAWNKTIRENMLEGLSSVYGIKKHKAIEMVEKYVTAFEKTRRSYSKY